MQNKSPGGLVRRFFSGDYSARTRERFLYWLRIGSDKVSKARAMRSIWDSLPGEAGDETVEEFMRLRRRIDSAAGKQVDAGNRKAPRRRLSWLSVARYAAAIVVAVAATAAYFVIVNHRISAPMLVEHHVLEGVREKIALPDGSQVWINAGSVLIYPETFAGKKREVYLVGEANFTVAPNPSKPFIVRSHEFEVEALGTVFNMKSYPGADVVRTSLQEGSVRVTIEGSASRSAYTALLKPDDQLSYSRSSDRITLEKVDSEALALWTEGHLVFQNAPLEEIVMSLEHKYNISVEYDAERLAGRTYYVKFRPEESLEEAATILGKLTKTKHRISGKVVYIK